MGRDTKIKELEERMNRLELIAKITKPVCPKKRREVEDAGKRVMYRRKLMR